MWKFFTQSGLEKVQAAPIVASLDYAQVITPSTPQAGTEATAVTMITSNPVSYDGTPIWIETFIPWLRALNTAGTVWITMWDGATDLGNWGQANPGTAGQPFFAKGKYTPSPGIHTFTMRLWTNPGAPGYAGFDCGPGGIGNYKPAFINIYKA